MCWIGELENKRIAIEDIPIYKIMIKGNRKDCFSSYFWHSDYIKNEIRQSIIIVEDKFEGKEKEIKVNVALHSYSIEHTFIEKAYTGDPRFDNNYTCIYIKDRFNKNTLEFYDDDKLIVVKGYIPKDSVYYINNRGEVISNKLIMTKICSGKELEKLSK